MGSPVAVDGGSNPGAVSMNVSRSTLVIGLAAACAGPAAAAYFNVSDLVTGSVQVNGTLAAAPKLACGSACKYRSQSSAGMSDGYAIAPDGYLTDNWELAFASGGSVHTPANVAWTLAVPPAPGGVGQLGGSIGVYERARVTWDSGAGAGEPNLATVQTWKSGTGASVVSYAIRLTTPSGGAKPTFLSFTVPERLHGYSDASYVEYNQNFYLNPTRVQSRAAVDVYVDGLPVWSSEVNSLAPKRYMPPNHGQLLLSWDQPLDGDQVTLFLGNLPSGSTRTVVVAMRADLRVEAPTCRTSADNYGVQHQSCHSQREGLALPGFNSGGQYFFIGPDVQLYTK
jgi:hypothetical protein